MRRDFQREAVFLYWNLKLKICIQFCICRASLSVVTAFFPAECDETQVSLTTKRLLFWRRLCSSLPYHSQTRCAPTWGWAYIWRKIFRALTGSGGHPASYPMDIRGYFLRREGEVAEAWSWPLTSMKCWEQETWSCTSSPLRLYCAVFN
jgi:hypothetical protein